MVKYYGPGSSASLDPEGRNFETVCYQQSKAVLDKELNAQQDFTQSLFQKTRMTPSGWLSSDVTDSSALNIFTATTTANLYEFPVIEAMVNGWNLNVAFTGSLTDNTLDLGAPPVGVASKRTDLVILEAWRRLVLASPSTEGKSPSGRIWREGNIKIASANDAALNFTDDLIDSAVGAETTKRVQVQYRLRVVQGVDLDMYPRGIDDPSVFASSVPATALAPDGVATAFNYANQALNKDSGLWVAGDGDPTNALGTVDGYIYAIPMCAVFRRNTSAFDRDNNQNGGVATPGPSDRPDGLFYDILTANDILDLRQHVSASGWSYSELLEKNTNYLLDNGLKSEIITTPLGGGIQGHTTLWADEIGSIDNSGANLIRDFDGACRTFSDRPILETVVLRYYSADQVGGGATWEEGSVLVIDPTNLPIYPYPNSNLSASAPGSVSILGIPNAAYIRTLAGGASYYVDLPDAIITGLGQVPAASVTFRVPTQFHNEGGDGDGFVLLRVVVSYPAGQGLTKTPTDAYGAASFVNELPANLPATDPYNFASGSGSFDAPHREVTLRYTTSDVTFTQRIFSIGSNPFIQLPDRAIEISSIVKSTGGVYTGPITIADDGYGVTIVEINANWSDGGIIYDNDIIITYKAVRPMPDNGVQFTIWYEARAAQTVRDLSLGTTLRVIPRYVSRDVYCLVGGPGSLDDSYPFPVQSVQTPGVYPSSAGSFSGDHELDGSGTISIATFDSDTGFVRVPALIPVVSEPQTLIFNRDSGDVDIEGRSYFKEVPTGYIPSSFGQPLSDPKKHKNLVPMICELVDTSAIGVAGTLVLVVLSRWATFDAKNSVAFDPDLATNYTTASVYRLKGNPLSNRRSN